MASYYLSPILGAGGQLFDNQGRVLAGGKLYTYQAGTTTPLATYTDSTGSTPNANPIILDSAGRLTQEIWFLGGSTYKFVLQDSTGASVGPTMDNLKGINDVSTASAGSIWVSSGLTPSYISANQFQVAGDQTALFPVGSRVQFIVTAGTYAGTVSAVAFGAATTVTVVPDSTGLDAGLSAVNISPLTVTKSPSGAGTEWFDGTVQYPAKSTGYAIQSEKKTTTTTGSSSSYLLSPNVKVPALQSGTIWNVQFHTNSAVNPTLNIDSLGAKNLKMYDSSGSKIGAIVYANQITRVAYDGTDFIVLDRTQQSASQINALYTGSNAASGYQTLPGGLLMQWVVSTITFGGTSTINWPTPFTANPLSVMVNNGAGDYTGITESFPIVISTSSSNVVVANQYIGDAAGSPVTVKAQILAIGF